MRYLPEHDQNTIDLLHLRGIETPRVAVLAAVETANPAALTVMAARGQMQGAGQRPLVFDNAISLRPRGPGHRLAGYGQAGHPARTRPESRQHAGKADDLLRLVLGARPRIVLRPAGLTACARFGSVTLARNVAHRSLRHVQGATA